MNKLKPCSSKRIIAPIERGGGRRSNRILVQDQFAAMVSGQRSWLASQTTREQKQQEQDSREVFCIERIHYYETTMLK